MTPTRAVLPLLVVVACSALAGCGDERPTGADDPPPTTPAPAHTHPTGAADAVVTVATGGGFVPAEYAFIERPELVVAGDDVVYSPREGDHGLGAIVPVVAGRVDETEVDRVLALADEAGLLAPPPDYHPGGDVMISDVATTTVTIRADGHRWTHSAYALHDLPSGETPARKRLRDFVDAVVPELQDAAGEGPAPVTSLRLRAETQPSEPSEPPGAAARAWSVPDVDLAEVGSCTVVRGATAAEVARVLADHGSADYRQGGVTYAVHAAVVLPGERAPCADHDLG